MYRIIIIILITAQSWCWFASTTWVADAAFPLTSTTTRLLGWKWEDYPHPGLDAATCRTQLSYRFCDPDLVIRNDMEVSQIEQYLNQTRVMPISLLCPKMRRQKPLGGRYGGGLPKRHLPNSPTDNEGQETVVEIQMGVALVAKMDLSYSPMPISSSSSKTSTTAAADKAAESFARSVHNVWGVGYNIPLCAGASTAGTGVLLFLSLLDRTMYISRGAALDKILTDARLDRVIARMRPKLQQGQYSLAILDALHEMDHYILMSGPPNIWEKFGDFVAAYAGLGFFLLILTSFGCMSRHEHLRKREYAKAASQLAEIERLEAEALQGRFQARSCPICLELFPVLQQEQQQPMAESPSPQGAAGSTAAAAAAGGATAAAWSLPIGTDGKPVRLLRCGHVFDQHCFNEWVSTGFGSIDKCPICQQGVGKSTSRRTAPGMMEATTSTLTSATSAARETTTTIEGSLLRHRNAGANGGTGTHSPETRPDFVAMQQPLHAPSHSVSRVVPMFQRERNFRLQRLHDRYPRFIQMPMVERWTADTYRGPLVQDPAFAQLDPNRLRGDMSSNNHRRPNRVPGRRSTTSSKSGFGGGSSGGGRGGRW